MRNFYPVLAAAALLNASAFAADINTSPLAPGKPAGLRTAQDDNNTIYYIVGLGAIAAGIALVASNNNNGGTPPSTTPSTQ